MLWFLSVWLMRRRLFCLLLSSLGRMDGKRATQTFHRGAGKPLTKHTMQPSNESEESECCACGEAPPTPRPLLVSERPQSARSQPGQVLSTDARVFHGQLSRVVSIQRAATGAAGLQLCPLLVLQQRLMFTERGRC